VFHYGSISTNLWGWSGVWFNAFLFLELKYEALFQSATIQATNGIGTKKVNDKLVTINQRLLALN
jgi:hypothetical protein